MNEQNVYDMIKIFSHTFNALQLTKHFHISYLILTTLLVRYYYPHFRDKAIEVQRD